MSHTCSGGRSRIGAAGIARRAYAGSVHVAAVQLTASTDVAGNLRRARQSVREAAGRGAKLVVIPEAAMHPFGAPDLPLAPVAQHLDGPWVSGLADVATQTATTVLAGMFEAVPGESRVRNTVVAVDENGLRGAYRKVHLYDALGWVESERFVAGDPAELLTLDVHGVTVGVLTCYDLRFPEIARALVDAGASVLAIPAAWVAGPLKEAHWTTLARARAIENTSWVIAAAQGPPTYAGSSMIVDPMGVPVTRLGEADGVAVADVDEARTRAVRRSLPTLEQRRFAVLPGRT
jgi:predicted amidohydrolase